MLRVARLLGRTLGELEGVSHAELRLWATYYELEPWGYEIENFRAALIAYSARVDAWGSRGKRYPGKLEDFMRASPVRPRVQLASPRDVMNALGLRYPGDA